MEHFDAHRGGKWRDFDISAEVFVKGYGNNGWKWVPGTVTANVNYLMKAADRNIKLHSNLMKNALIL